MTLQKPKIAEKIDNNSKEIVDARVDFYNNNHNDLGLRLREDFSNVHNKINNASLIEQTGQDITVNHSYAGYTEGLKVSGNTYQNIANNGIIQNNRYRISSNLANDKIQTIISENSAEAKFIEQVTTSYFYFFVKDTLFNNFIKPNTTYSLSFDIYSNKSEEFIAGIMEGNTSNVLNTASITFSTIANTWKSINIELKTKPDFNGINLGNQGIHLKSSLTNTVREIGDIYKVKNVMLLENSSNNTHSYFEGIESVGEKESNKISILSKNKNLFNKDLYLNKNDYNKPMLDGVYSWLPIKVKSNTQYNFNVLTSNLSKLILISTTKDINTGWFIDFRQANRQYNLNKTSNSEGEFYIGFYGVNDTDLNDVLQGSLIQISEGSTSTPYEPQKVNKKDILLPQPLRGFESGAKDLIEEVGNKVNHVKKIGKIILNGTRAWRYSATYGDVYRFDLTINDVKPNCMITSDKFPKILISTPNVEGINVHAVSNIIQLQIKTNKLAGQQPTDLINYLKANPVTVYYELATPIVTLLDIDSIELQTFDTTTYATSENAIKPTLTFKTPVNVPALVNDLKQENIQLKEEIEVVNTKNLELNTEILGVQDFALDVDFRACITEMDIVDIKNHIGLK